MNEKYIANVLKEGNNILILPHIMADGDTLGSCIALYLAFKSLGKNPLVLLDEDIPYNLKFLLRDEYIVRKLEPKYVPDMALAVDCSDMDRLGDRKHYFNQVQNTINIDHHITNRNFAKINYVQTEASATGEIVFSIIKALGLPLTKDISTCLYTAIVSDTGSFKYDNTTTKTLQIAAELLEQKIDLNYIVTNLYQNKPLQKVKLLANALSTQELYCSGKLSLLLITNEMIERAQATPMDTDGIIEFARDIAGVEVGVLLKEISSKEVKVGFRSKYDFDVSKIAEKFGGGGHKKASGCTIYDTIEKAKNIILSEISQHLR